MTALAIIKKFKCLHEAKQDLPWTYKAPKEDVKLMGAAAESVRFNAKILSEAKKLDESCAGLAKLG